MAFNYVDFDVPTNPAADGSIGNAYGVVQYKALSASQAQWYTKGNLNDPTYDLVLNRSAEYRPWNLILYAPSRINVNSISIGNQSSCMFYNMIIYMVSASAGCSSLSFIDCFVKCSERFNYAVTQHDSMLNIYESTFIASILDQSGDYSNKQLNSDNSLVILSGFIRQSWSSHMYSFNRNSAFLSDISDLPKTACQTNFIAPVWPAWNDPKEDFAFDLLKSNLSSPPSPGCSFSISPSDIWGKPRTDIGGFYFIQAPSADFSATPLEGNTPLSVQFTDQSTGNVSYWVWDFGDGNTLSGSDPQIHKNPIHTYSDAGTFSVRLTVSPVA